MTTRRYGVRNTLAVLATLGSMICASTAMADEFKSLELSKTKTVYGKKEDAKGYYSYLGLRFAKPPVGDLRWRAPQPLDANDKGIQPDRGKFGSACLQPGLSLSGKVGNEDCLFLNVFQPISKEGNPKNLPVMVWIYGGGGVIGKSDSYDPSGLVRNEVIVVTVNYRLGALAYLAHPSLNEGDTPSGNYAHLDNIAALKWVKENIARFGGDSGNVTIFGESRGATSVAALMASPAAKGYFHKAISQSTPLIPNASLESAYAFGKEFAGKKCPVSTSLTFLGVTPEWCLRHGLSSEAALDAAPLLESFFRSQTYVTDGVNFKEDILKTFDSGDSAKIPLMIGVVKDEWGSSGESIPVLNAKSVFYCPSVKIANATSKSNPNAKVYAYRLDEKLIDFSSWADSSSPVAGINGLLMNHAADLPYVFDVNISGIDLSAFSLSSPEKRNLADRMKIMWTNFAKTGSPNSNGSDASWKPYTEADRELKVLSSKGDSDALVEPSYCAN